MTRRLSISPLPHDQVRRRRLVLKDQRLFLVGNAKSGGVCAGLVGGNARPSAAAEPARSGIAGGGRRLPQGRPTARSCFSTAIDGRPNDDYNFEGAGGNSCKASLTIARIVPQRVVLRTQIFGRDRRPYSRSLNII
jgi:hypothetical protein